MPTDPSESVTQASPPETQPPDATPRRVLIVEDDEELAALLQVWVQDWCGRTASISVAHSIADAKSTVAARSAIDIVLLDRRLPDGDASDLLEVLACQFDAIVVMITAVSPGEDLVRLPVTDYMVKPIDNETFVTQLSLLERLRAANALDAYTDARKASLLEYHLESPHETPLFRRFAARWSYDRLEIAHVGGRAVVYELYAGDETDDGDEDGAIHVSIAGSLATDLDTLLETGDVEPVGELFPSGGEYAWIRVDGTDRIERDPDSIAIYGFDCETPEQYVTDAAATTVDARDEGNDGLTHVEIASILESGFN